MIILNDAMRKAISDAVNDTAGGQAELARKTNVFQQNFSRYISGQTTKISERMWQQIYPYLKKYLPDGYEPDGYDPDGLSSCGIEFNIQKDYRSSLKYCMTVLNQDAIPDKVKVDLVRQYIESILK